MEPAAIMEGLTDYERLPVTAIRAASAQREEILPEFLRLIENHIENGPGPDEAGSGLLLIFHLLGEWREHSAYRPLARLLRAPDIHDVLEVTATASRVMAAVFDGDPEPLYEVILDPRADEFARAEVFETLAMVVGDGRLLRDEVARFLAQCFNALEPAQGCFVWCGWQEAIARLGLEELRPLVREAFDRGSIEEGWLSYEDFEEDLAYAMAHPEKPYQSWERQPLPFEDTVAELSRWYGFSEAYFADQRRFARERERREQVTYAIESPTAPFINPSRDVGRNDPCPCGSGKKYKKCCLN
jgi:hypothetical protein